MDDHSTPYTRTCTRCSRTLPATAEYFWRHRAIRGGLDTRCRGCANRRQAMTTRERFEKHVGPADERGCHHFMRGVGIYGRFTIDGYRVAASRASWLIYRGPIPEGMEVCHVCDVPRCVNPAHLFVGTRTDNMRDASAKGRMRAPRGEASPRTTLTDAQVVEMRVRYARGESTAKLAAAYGIARSTAGYIMQNRTWTHVEAGVPTDHTMRGEGHYLSKLTADGVRDIRRRVEAGEPQVALAREYGVHQMTVNAVVHRRAWKDLS